MTICQSCGAERSDQDRFCRMCGAPVATSVGDLVDTRRFNPAAPAAAGSRELPPPFYVSPATAYPTEQASSLPYQTASLRKKFTKRRFAWVMASVLVTSVTLAGIGIGARALKRGSRYRSQPVEQSKPFRRPFNEDIQNALGFKAGNISDAGYPGIKGVFVESLVTDDGPAALANIQAGDVLTDLNEQPVRNPGEVAQVLDALKPGTEVSAKILREGEPMSPRIKIADRAFPPIQPKLEPKEQGYLGVKESVRRCCVPNAQKWGVEILGTNDNGPADLAGLRAGDVITEFNGSPVRTPGEFNRRTRITKPRSKVSVTFYRGNTKQTAEMTLGYRW